MWIDTKIPIKLSFANFIESFIRIAVDLDSFPQEIKGTLIGFFDKAMLHASRSIAFTFKL